MALTGNEVKVSLKIVVDIKARKVVFAEAKKDFVDFLFYILSLPLSTVVKLLNEKGMMGCLGSLYKSVESLDTEYFEPNHNKHSVLSSKLPVVVPLLSLNDVPSSITFYKCPAHQSATYEPRVDCCTRGMTLQSFNYLKEISRNEGFVKAVVAYMVMDDLEVKPLSITLIKDHVNDFDYFEEMQVQVGVKENDWAFRLTAVKTGLTAVKTDLQSVVVNWAFRVTAVKTAEYTIISEIH
ncbi:uncharacterized protein LOC141614709 [Silene latifolia]|uniref:uncharacterized protein LOC141614709 n=1 Tax=Silene latifolia TaxID=37657 RepID=UPI003D77A130